MDYVLADFLWARAVLLLGPTVATLGLSVQVGSGGGAVSRDVHPTSFVAPPHHFHAAPADPPNKLQPTVTT
jgi:hypothetical protein